MATTPPAPKSAPCGVKLADRLRLPMLLLGCFRINRPLPLLVCQAASFLVKRASGRGEEGVAIPPRPISLVDRVEIDVVGCGYIVGPVFGIASGHVRVLIRADRALRTPGRDLRCTRRKQRGGMDEARLPEVLHERSPRVLHPGERQEPSP